MSARRCRNREVDIDTAGWRELGWNGVRMWVPIGWNPARIADRYLLLENSIGPVMEIKWNRIKGAFQAKYHQRKIAAEFNKKGVELDMQWPVPPSWKQALRDFDISGFKWRSKTFSGKGIFVFCTECRRVCLLQFYEKIASKNADLSNMETFQKVLRSFSEHASDEKRLWSLYDFRFITPENFSLKNFQFSPGAFRLRFHVENGTVTFHRWSPGTVILDRHGNLEAFARKVLSYPIDSEISTRGQNHKTCVNLQGQPPSSRMERWRKVVSRKALFRWAKVWYLPMENRILGVEAESKKNVEPDLMESICESYGLV